MPPSVKDVVLRHHDEVWSRGNLAAVDEIYALDFVGHHPGSPDWVGRERVKEVVAEIRQAFPDFREDVDDVIVAGSRVVTRFTASGTHLGPLRGLAPTGKRMSVAEMGIFRVVENKIVEKWGLLDRLGMLQQLGALPGTAPRLEFLYEITMDAEVDDLGPTPSGRRRIVRVTGGRFEGPKLKGTVLAGGGDRVLERGDGTRALDVRITLRTDDGHLIYVQYPGRFHGAADVMQRIVRGEVVDASEYYFRTAPLFETASEKYGWLNGIVAIGIGRRTRQQVAYTVHAIL